MIARLDKKVPNRSYKRFSSSSVELPIKWVLQEDVSYETLPGAKPQRLELNPTSYLKSTSAKIYFVRHSHRKDRACPLYNPNLTQSGVVR